jgi:hypothetical protein
MLQRVSWEVLPILKEVFLTLILGWCLLTISIFIADFTNEFILDLDILNAYDVPVGPGHQMLHLAGGQVSLWSLSLPAW